MREETTGLRIQVRELQNLSGNNDVENKMKMKVDELERVNMETMLRTYKGNVAFISID